MATVRIIKQPKRLQQFPQCARCGEHKPQDAFPVNRTMLGGRNFSHCVECVKTSRAAYRAANRERIRAKNREYWQQRGEATIERDRERNRKYREAHPHRIRRALSKSNAKRRAQVTSTVGVVTLTKEQLAVLQGGVCALCSKPFTLFDPFTLDHIIPLSKDGIHDDSNFQAVHKSCNSKKGNKLPGEF